MATIVRLDELYINLDTVTRIKVEPGTERVKVVFAGIFAFEEEGYNDTLTLSGEQGARFLKWLDRHGKVEEA